MAQYPCDADEQRYRGKQQTMYPAIVNGTTAYRRKVRLCPVHFNTFCQNLAERARKAQIEFEEAAFVKCFVCGEPVSTSAWTLFVTSYADGQERDDYWAPLHDECVGAARAAWLLDGPTAA